MRPLPYQWTTLSWSAREHKNKPLPSVRTYSPFPVLSFSLHPFFRSFFAFSFPFTLDRLKSMLAMHMVPIVVVVVIIKESWKTQGLCFTCSRARVKRTVKTQVKFIITKQRVSWFCNMYTVIEILQYRVRIFLLFKYMKTQIDLFMQGWWTTWTSYNMPVEYIDDVICM